MFEKMTCLGVVYSELTLKGMFNYLCLKEVLGHWARALHNFFLSTASDV